EKLMTVRIGILSFGLVLLALPGAAMANNTVLSGVFHGSEPGLAALPGACYGATSLQYQVISNVQVGATGTYVVADVWNVNAGDISALIYNGAFNPNNPQANLLTTNGIDIADAVDLTAGNNYTLVVQHWCQNGVGAWAVAFSGPGNVTSGKAVTVPDFTEGGFTNGDPTAATDCGESQYQVSGPIQVSRDGRYYYSDLSINYEVDMCLQVYSAPFNANSPNANRVGDPMDDWGFVDLVAGQDYYFVAQPLGGPDTGEFFYVLAPPASFSITHAMAGAWYYPVTEGQGLFVDISDQLNTMFLAWFTYDLERPDPAVTAMIGDPGHRWLTAQGPFAGDTANLDIYWTSGGIFDSGEPQPPPPDQDGTMTVQFNDCSSGTVTYDLGTAGVSGQFPIQRIFTDTENLCQSALVVPGQPGPL
ncbi:MAG: hypothetical protein PVJ17_03945, partial [Lysobacterales bacterium]